MDLDVIIVGAGLVGLSLARALHASGLRSALLAAEGATTATEDEWDARIYAISPGSREFLLHCGVWQRIAPERITAVEAMQVHGDKKGARLDFSAYEAGLAQLCFIVESRELERALNAALDGQDKLTRLTSAELHGLAFDAAGVELEIEGGATLHARLVVGADGAHSRVREAAGIEVRSRDYKQTAVVANFETERAHDAIARQWFRPDGVLALLPLPGNRVSMVWSTWDAHAEHLLALDAAALAQEVEAASAAELGCLRTIVAARGFPLRLTRVASLVRPRVALVGDAAHAVHPLAGQGVNLGFQDARELARVLIERGAQDDCGDFRLLRRYARARAEPVALMQATTDALQRLFGKRATGLSWLRNAGLDLTDRVPGLKKVLIEHALG